MGRRLSDEAIVEMYRQRQSSFDVALEAGCSSETVRAIVRAAGEPIRKVGGGNKGRYKTYRLPDAEVCTLYRQGHGMTLIADLAGTCPTQIKHILERHNVPIRTVAQANRLLAKKRPRTR